jgi:ATP-dependent helicase HrpA
LSIRIDRLPTDPDKDRARMAEILPWEERFRVLVASLPEARRDEPEVAQIAAQLAEWRVSLFAQPMKTAFPVSRQRIEKALKALSADPA